MAKQSPPSPPQPPPVIKLAMDYPWLVPLLLVSATVTTFALTRRPPPGPEPIPPAIEPAAETPPPPAEAQAETPMPVAAPEPEPAAPAALPAKPKDDEPLTQGANGAWRGPALNPPPGR